MCLTFFSTPKIPLRATPLNLYIVFQCKHNRFCIMFCENKLLNCWKIWKACDSVGLFLPGFLQDRSSRLIIWRCIWPQLMWPSQNRESWMQKGVFLLLKIPQDCRSFAHSFTPSIIINEVTKCNNFTYILFYYTHYIINIWKKCYIMLVEIWK